MPEFAIILISTILVNNFVLVQFLGLCPFMGVSQKLESAFGMSIATAFVLVLVSGVTYLIDSLVLVPLDIVFLRTIIFILSIATVVGVSKILIEYISPVLYQILGIYIPLITTNCAVLGLALQNTTQADNLFTAMSYGLGAALGFSLILILFSATRERISGACIPRIFSGSPIAMITAGIISMAFFGFSGLV